MSIDKIVLDNILNTQRKMFQKMLLKNNYIIYNFCKRIIE